MSRSAPFLCSGLRFSQYAERSLALSYAWCARAPVSVRLRACSYNLLLRCACAPLEIQTTMILLIITVRSPRAFTSTLRCARRAPLLLHYGALAARLYFYTTVRSRAFDGYWGVGVRLR